MKVEVVSHKDDWTRKFLVEKEKLEEKVGGMVVKIFHIGSTSVENLKAKPIIDILLLVEDINKLDNYRDKFEALGYEVMGEYGIKDRRFYRKGKEKRTYHIHAFQYDNLKEIERHLLFRDYLRAHEDIKKEYGNLKEKLAEKYPEDIDSYCDGKDKYVKKIEEEAIRWHWENR